MNKAWIALGSNLGDRAVILGRAVELLGERGMPAERISHLYETRPEGGAEEPPYLNAVLEGRTDLPPEDLLQVMRAIEEELGRDPAHRQGPRTCDLDLLAVGDLVLDQDPQLTLPHPRLHRRAFVLVPLCELDVRWNHPRLMQSASDLLAELPADPKEVRLHGALPFHARREDPPASQPVLIRRDAEA